MTRVELSSLLWLSTSSLPPSLSCTRARALTHTHTRSLSPYRSRSPQALSGGSRPLRLHPPPRGVPVPRPWARRGTSRRHRPGGLDRVEGRMCGTGRDGGAQPQRVRVPADKTVGDSDRQRRESFPLQTPERVGPPSPRPPPLPRRRRANKSRRARGAPPSGRSSRGGPGAAFQGFLGLPRTPSPRSRPDGWPALRLPSLALPGGARFDVLVIQAEKKPSQAHVFSSVSQRSK